MAFKRECVPSVFVGAERLPDVRVTFDYAHFGGLIQRRPVFNGRFAARLGCVFGPDGYPLCAVYQRQGQAMIYAGRTAFRVDLQGLAEGYSYKANAAEANHAR